MTKPNPLKIACFSVAALDYFPQKKSYHAGGNSLNQTIRFKQMGYQSAFLGALGQDEAGDRIADLLTTKGVDTSHMHRLEGNTACNQLTIDEQGERHGVDGAWQGGVYEEFTLTQTDWDYLQGFDIWTTHANGANYQEAIKRKTSQQFMAVDFLHLDDYALLEQSLHAVDIAYFGGTEDMRDRLQAIAKKCKTLIVLTLGAKGSIGFCGDEVVEQAALPLKQVIDTTGCGDAFQAACTAHFYQHKNLRDALLAGAKLGREAASQVGGIPWS